MNTSTDTIKTRQQAECNRHFEYVQFQRRINEITDATERIALPMRNEFEYTFRGGDLYFGTENIRQLLDQTIERNKHVVIDQPQFMTELIRNYIERDEYDAQLALVSGDMLEDTLVVLSPIPDAVVGGVDLGAYDTQRMKTMARIYQRTDTGVRATSLSLDLSDPQGLDAIARRFGQEIPITATSEDILQMRFWGYSSSMDNGIVNMVRETYDRELSLQRGGTWFAGRQDQAVVDTMEFVEQQSDLLSQHLLEINRIYDMHIGDEQRLLLKQARYNFAAALTRRLRGDGDAASLGDAGMQARANGETYSGDCPVAMTASQTLSELAIGERSMTCPFCGLSTTGDPCASRLVCGKCAAEVKNGTVVSRGIGRKNALALMNMSDTTQRGALSSRPQSTLEIVQKKYGSNTSLRHQITLGGADLIAYDTTTGEEIAKL